MKNIQLTSWKTDQIVLPVLTLVGFLLLAAGFGCCLVSGPSDYLNWWQGFSLLHFYLLSRASSINAGISVGLALFIWSVFMLIRPAYPDRNWQTAEVILIPLFWLLLLVAADLSLLWLVQHSVQRFQDIFTPLLRS
jgi:hypothetical protein